MSVLNKLTEGIVNRDLAKQGAALLNKWERTGLLEGLNDRNRQNMACLLENQAKELLRESSAMANGDVEGFAAVAFPIVRRVFGSLVANELVSVQPMSLPSGLIFFLDFVYSPRLGDAADQVTADGGDRFGNLYDKSIYGTNQVASGITGGVDVVGATLKETIGMRQAVGGGWSSPTGSVSNIASADCDIKDQFLLGSATEAQKKLINYDPDLLALGDTYECCVLDTDHDDFVTANADFDNLAAFNIEGAELAKLADEAPATTRIVRRLTQVVSATEGAGGVKAVRFVLVNTAALMGTVSDKTNYAAWDVEIPLKDSQAQGQAVGSVQWDSGMPFEDNDNIPEIDIKVDSVAITAQTKKLKARWTPELGQDLNAYHNLDAEVELTSILSEQIALEIDREILADLVNGQTAGKYYWSRSPGLFVNRETGLELGATSAAPDFTGTVSEWYETLIETINDVSAQIHRKTLRGGANFVVVSPETANILEFTSGFRAKVSHEDAKGQIGAINVGSISKKWDVYVDPYFPRNVVLVGRKGNSFLESGYVYAPYVPLQTTPTIFGTEDFVPRKGVMTRYAKKMVRPDMYGLVIIRGLAGEAGS